MAVLFFQLDLTWILSVKVGFCTPVGCFEGAMSPLADFSDRRSNTLISLFDGLEAEFSGSRTLVFRMDPRLRHYPHHTQNLLLRKSFDSEKMSQTNFIL